MVDANIFIILPSLKPKFAFLENQCPEPSDLVKTLARNLGFHPGFPQAYIMPMCPTNNNIRA